MTSCSIGSCIVSPCGGVLNTAALDLQRSSPPAQAAGARPCSWPAKLPEVGAAALVWLFERVFLFMWRVSYAMDVSSTSSWWALCMQWLIADDRIGGHPQHRGLLFLDLQI